MTKSDQLLDAIGEVGLDLVDMAEKVRFPKSILRRAASVAACAALFLGVGLYARTWLLTSPGRDQIEQPPAAAEQPQTDVKESVSVSREVYILELPDENRQMAAVNGAGEILAMAPQMELILDRATEQPVAILLQEETDTDQSTAERVICDLEGRELLRLCAQRMDVLGNVAVVEFGAQKYGLYRLDGTPIREGLTGAVVLPDCIIGQTEGASWIVYGADGQVQLTLEDTLQYSHWNGKTTFVKQGEDGLWGVTDAFGNWLLEPVDGDIAYLFGGTVYLRMQDSCFLVELETGRTVSVPEGYGVEPYGDYLLWTTGEEEQQVFWLTDWYGKQILSDLQWMRWIDADADCAPELFLAKQGNAVLWVEPDGTERLRIEEAGAIEMVSADAAVYTKTIQNPDSGEWILDFALIDLQTGVGRRTFDKPYTSATALQWHTASGNARLTGYFLATYTGDDGYPAHDLLDASGNVIAENVINWDSEYNPGEAICTEEGYCRPDGSWLYRFS